MALQTRIIEKTARVVHRQNPISIFFGSNDQEIQGTKLVLSAEKAFSLTGNYESLDFAVQVVVSDLVNAAIDLDDEIEVTINSVVYQIKGRSYDATDTIVTVALAEELS